jgi:hypothetical protein
MGSTEPVVFVAVATDAVVVVDNGAVVVWLEFRVLSSIICSAIFKHYSVSRLSATCRCFFVWMAAIEIMLLTLSADHLVYYWSLHRGGYFPRTLLVVVFQTVFFLCGAFECCCWFDVLDTVFEYEHFLHADGIRSK